jgi:hypothetical protein
MHFLINNLWVIIFTRELHFFGTETKNALSRCASIIIVK